MMLKEFQHSALEDSNHILSSACLSAPIKDLAWAGARPLGHTYLYTFTHLTCLAPR